MEMENEWVSISDLMSGLMIIFMFIAISFMSEVEKDKKKISDIAETYQNSRINLYKEIEETFRNDLAKWDAEIDEKTLTVRFKDPKALFEIGKADLSIKFKNILEDFFPRFVSLLNKKEYSDFIKEIRIEGHTSSEWNDYVSENEAYFNNMKLSQDRTRAVLEYLFSIERIKKYNNFLMKQFTANGMSFSKKVIENNLENKEKSRRVEFRIITEAEEKIFEILEKTENKEVKK